MTNLFELLSLASSLLISTDEIDEAWRKLSRENHPDLGVPSHDDISSQLNEARATLSSPAGLLEHWLKVNGREIESRNASISESLMELFSKTNSSLSTVDRVIASHKKSQSALARSLLTKDAIAAQMGIQSQLAEITQAIQKIASRFPDFEKEAEESEFSKAGSALTELKFLEKWKGQCQARLLDLISLD